MNAPPGNWYEANRRYLMAAIAQVEAALKRYAAPNLQFQGTATENSQLELPAMSPPSALETLCHTFNFSEFDRQLLLLCAGMEFDDRWGSLCAAASGNPQQTYPTFSLALKVLPAPDWGALTHDAPLRWWRAIELGPGNSLTQCPLRIDERILHYLLGVGRLDERLVNYVEPMAIADIAELRLPPSHLELAQQVVAALGGSDAGAYPLVQLCGPDLAGKRAIAAAACSAYGWGLHAIAADAIPSETESLTNLARLWERDALLSRSALFLECDLADDNDHSRYSAIARLIDNSRIPLIISSRDRRTPRKRSFITFEVGPATPSEQRAIWQAALGDSGDNLNGHLERLAANFSFSAATIYAACAEAKSREIQADGALSNALWEACREKARSRMDNLAQRIESAATWDDLVLPETQHQTLREIVARVRQRTQVYESWGFANKSARGLGISALFAGASGTGKTMAADVMAKELRLDLYRIDLSSVISKYIGETEKNLRRVFDAAEAGGCILLFDEADALFGKRSEVKDSHDRYANIEVSYLLQRMEAYRGLAILTTNLKDSLDRAFLRRLSFAIQFPFPDAADRAEIWRRTFPQQTPTANLDFRKLSQLNIAGGNIRNIALNAAFMAADAGEPVGMKHLLAATHSEYVKLERPLTDAEVAGWISG
ncbi:MAG: ATP-binding protein [Actinomycetota bacterium]